MATSKSKSTNAPVRSAFNLPSGKASSKKTAVKRRAVPPIDIGAAVKAMKGRRK